MAGVALRCQVGEDDKVDRRDIPAWMFDRAVCSQMQLSQKPHVALRALTELVCLFDDAALRQGGHNRRPLESGGADDKQTTKVKHVASTESVRAATAGTEMERCCAGRASDGDEVGRTDVASPLETRGRTFSKGGRQ